MEKGESEEEIYLLNKKMYLSILILPLMGSIISGLLGRKIGVVEHILLHLLVYFYQLD